VLTSFGKLDDRSSRICVLAEVQLDNLVSECVVDILSWLAEYQVKGVGQSN
jgi:hypothetical protein